MNYSVKYHVIPTTFHVISRKIAYLWDSVIAAARLLSDIFHAV